MRSSEHGAVALGANGTHYLAQGRIEGEDPLAPFSPTAPQHLLRTDGFEHVADIMVGSFYDPDLDEGCAFEELISFHGGIGGLQTRPFILHPPTSRSTGPSSAPPASTASSPAGGNSSAGSDLRRRDGRWNGRWRRPALPSNPQALQDRYMHRGCAGSALVKAPKTCIALYCPAVRGTPLHFRKKGAKRGPSRPECRQSGDPPKRASACHRY